MAITSFFDGAQLVPAFLERCGTCPDCFFGGHPDAGRCFIMGRQCWYVCGLHKVKWRAELSLYNEHRAVEMTENAARLLSFAEVRPVLRLWAVEWEPPLDDVDNRPSPH